MSILLSISDNMMEWRKVSEEERTRLNRIAKTLEGIEIRESVDKHGVYYPSGKTYSDFDNVLSKKLKEYSKRDDLVGRKVTLEKPVSLRNVEFWEGYGSIVATFIDNNDKIIGESPLSGLLYILMEDGDDKVFYVKVSSEEKKMVADIRPAKTSRIDENSEILTVILPKTNDIFTTEEYLQGRKEKSQRKMLSKLGTLREKLFYIPGDVERIIVVGDLHGDYESFKNALELHKNDKKSFIVFLGDYGDRGENGVEIIEELCNEISRDPSILALKGNHEDYDETGRPSFQPCDLIYEVERKRGRGSWKNYFQSFLKPFFDSLPLSAIYRGELNLFFVHGGISSKIRSEEDLKNPKKEQETDLIWSDPYNGMGEWQNSRGAGVSFGKHITEEFCKRLNIDYIIRSHEPTKAFNSPVFEHDGKVITISSTSAYDTAGSKAKPHALIIEGRRITEYYLK